MLEHGTLSIEWLRDDHVMMTGGIALAFKGEPSARCFPEVPR